MAHDILGHRPANISCNIKSNCRKDCCKRCRHPRRAACCPGLFLRLCLASPIQPPPAPTMGDLLRAPTPCCCVDQHATKWQIGALQVLTTNRMFSDLRRPSVHLPPLPAVGPFSSPYGPSHFGPSARKHFLQDKIKLPKRLLHKVPAPTSRRLLPWSFP